MKAEFTKDGVAYTIEGDNSSGNTYMDAVEFRTAVCVLASEDIPKVEVSKSNS